MRNDNICKFIPSVYSDKLSVSCFVLEAQHEVMMNVILMKEHQVVLVTQGEGSFWVDGRELTFTSGTLLFFFTGEKVSCRPTSSCRYMYIRFFGARAEELFRRFGISEHNRLFTGFGSLVPLWSESLSRASQQTVDLAAESMLLYTFSRLFEGLTKENSIVSRMVEISEDQFSDPELSLTTVAEALSYNPKYLSTVFKEKKGIGYSEYLTSLRVKFAISLFDHGIDSVKNVALLSGFKDPLYFSSVFKKITGMSPKEYKTPPREES